MLLALPGKDGPYETNYNLSVSVKCLDGAVQSGVNFCYQCTGRCSVSSKKRRSSNVNVLVIGFAYLILKTQ